MQEILKDYGIPADVSFFLFRPTEPTTDLFIEYDIILHYDDIDLSLTYGSPRVDDFPEVKICPLFDPIDDRNIYIDIGKGSFIFERNNLEVATSLTLEEFYDIMLRDPEDACFMLKTYMQPPE